MEVRHFFHLAHDREDAMITLKSSTSDGTLFQVFDNDKLIGLIRKEKGSSGDRYIASLDVNGEGKSLEKEFHASHEALRWIEKNKPYSLSTNA
jgi:hypothetical protein